MSVFGFIFFLLIFYFIFKIFIKFLRFFTSTPSKRKETNFDSKPTTNKNLNINKEDIIEADFEEIKDEKD